MATKRWHHTDLLVWQKGMDLVVLVYELTKKLPRDERFGLISQGRRAAVSVPSNIAEGHGRLHRGDFIHQLSYANGSLAELDTQGRLWTRLGFLTADECQPMLEMCEESGRMVSGLIRSLGGHRYPLSSIR